MRAFLAALVVCLFASLQASPASATHVQKLQADSYSAFYAGPGAMPVYRYEAKAEKIRGHATTGRRMDRMPVTRRQVAHVEAPRAARGGIVTVETVANIPITVATSVASKFQDLIADLVEHGYMPKEIGCFARGGHIKRSFHYRGLACDIDQDAKNVTSHFMYSKEAHALIREHGLDDGCDFGDCGHVSYGEIVGGSHSMHRYVGRHHRHHYAGA
jgi:hypothetical protein